MLLLGLNFTPSFLYLLPITEQRDRSGVYSQFIIVLLLLPPWGENYSHSSPASVWGPSHRIKSCINVNMIASHGLIIHKLLQRESLPHGAILHERAPPTWVSHGSPHPQQTCSIIGLPGAWYCTSFPQGHSLLWIQTSAPVWGPLWAAGRSLFHRGCPWAAGAQLPHHGLHQRLQGNLFSDGWSTSSLSFFTDLGVYRVFFLMHSNSSLHLQVRIPSPPPFLNFITPEVLPLLLTGSALASSGSIVKLAGIASVRHDRSF